MDPALLQFVASQNNAAVAQAQMALLQGQQGLPGQLQMLPPLPTGTVTKKRKLG